MQAMSLGIAGKVCRHSKQRQQGRHNRHRKLIRLSRRRRLSEHSISRRPGASIARFGGMNNNFFGRAQSNFGLKVGVKDQRKKIKVFIANLPVTPSRFFYVRGTVLARKGASFARRGKGSISAARSSSPPNHNPSNVKFVTIIVILSSACFSTVVFTLTSAREDLFFVVFTFISRQIQPSVSDDLFLLFF